MNSALVYSENYEFSPSTTLEEWRKPSLAFDTSFRRHHSCKALNKFSAALLHCPLEVRSAHPPQVATESLGMRHAVKAC